MKHFISLLFTVTYLLCFGFVTAQDVTSVNGETGVVQINLSLNGNELGITGGNTIGLPYGNSNITSIGTTTGFTGGGNSGDIIIDAEFHEAFWNASKLNGNPVKAIASSPENGHLLKWNGTEWSPSADKLDAHESSIWTETGTGLALNRLGSVKIGSSGSDAKLAVKGKIKAESLLVSIVGPAPDYVFEKDYPLMNLSCLNEFLGKNKHLPGIPTAQEIKEKGFGLAEMSMLLLKKTEELTLYIIENEKRLNDLTNRNN